MHQFVSFNHQIAEAGKVHLPAATSAAFYGRGIFTTLAVYHSEPFQWKKHWSRLLENAEKLSIDLSEFTEEKVRRSLMEIINRNDLKMGRVRLTFFDESLSGIWETENPRRSSLLITTANLRIRANRLRLTISADRVNSMSPLANIKSCNYLEKLLALDAAKKLGFDEAIRLNERGEITSASMANVFWIKEDHLFTPPPAAGALRGTTREFLLENFAVNEKLISLEELKNADEIFLTSAGIGIARVESLDEIRFKESKIFAEIKDRFAEAIGEKL